MLLKVVAVARVCHFFGVLIVPFGPHSCHCCYGLLSVLVVVVVNLNHKRFCFLMLLLLLISVSAFAGDTFATDDFANACCLIALRATTTKIATRYHVWPLRIVYATMELLSSLVDPMAR